MCSLWLVIVLYSIKFQESGNDLPGECTLQSLVGLLLTLTDVLTLRGDHHIHDYCQNISGCQQQSQ